MSVEQFANLAQTTINQVGGIAAGDTSMTVSSNTGFPANASFRCRIDSELVLVTAGQGGVTWTIQRNLESTTAAAHANGATVTQVVTNGGLLNAFMTKIDEFPPLGVAAASITFPNLITAIPQTFRNLVVIFQARGDTAALSTLLSMQFNSDTAANYEDELFYGNNATPTASPDIAGTGGRFAHVAAGTAGAGFAGAGTIYIYNYTAATFIKNWTCFANASDSNVAADQYSTAFSGKWRGTAAITTIKIFPAAGNLAVGSTFTLYGLP